MKYENKEGKIISKGFCDAEACMGLSCNECPVQSAYLAEGLRLCSEYVDKHGEAAAFALLGYHPVEEDQK